jgi:hypothetical protein
MSKKVTATKQPPVVATTSKSAKFNPKDYVKGNLSE